MKAVVIVLVLIAAGFVAVLAVGVGRHEGEDKGPPAAAADCSRFPSIKGKDPDPDLLEDWCPPDVLASLENLAGSRTKGIAIENPRVGLSGQGLGETRAVPPAEEPDSPPRLVKLVLTEGSWARVTSSQPRKDSQTVCLCRDGAQLQPDELSDDCGKRWKAKQAQVCQPGEDRAVLGFDPLGGSLSYRAERRATVVAER
jgi:hypothetical protein